MRFVVHQLSALQGAAKLAADWRQACQWYLIEGDALGAANADRMAWVYEHAAALMVPALMDRPEPELEDFEPSIEPAPVFIIREVDAESYLPKVIVEEPDDKTRPALRLLKGGWFQEDENRLEHGLNKTTFALVSRFTKGESIMSYWKAYAAAREIPEGNLRDALIEALLRTQDVEAALGLDLYPGQSIEDAIQGIREERNEAVKEKDDAESELEERLQENVEDANEKLRNEVENLQAERDDLEARLAKVEPLLDCYSDTLAFARRFVVLAEGSGVKPRHVRNTRRSSAR